MLQKKVIGVKALVENIEVKFPSDFTKSDIEVANEVLSALRSNMVCYKRTSAGESWKKDGFHLKGNYHGIFREKKQKMLFISLEE